jgi:uncharacterized protein
VPDTIWLLAGIAVFLASALQTATGAGLGLIAGPALLLAMTSSAAIHVAAVLNLVLSLALLPFERHQFPRVPFAWLCVGAAIGVPFGAWILHIVSLPILQLLTGIAVTLGGVQLLIAERTKRDRIAFKSLVPFGVLAGIMTAAMAIPGPAALWGLARSTLQPAQVRAVLRGFFVVVYIVTLAIHSAIGMPWAAVVDATLWMLPCLAAGAIVGTVIKGRASARTLRLSFLILLLVMGVALLGNSAKHYLSFEIS